MSAFRGITIWEALKSLRGLFTSSGADISLTQQQASTILPSRDDEAIQLALDAALVETTNGLAHLEHIQQVRAKLEPHQQRDWRLNLTSLKMTERFEQVVISETTIKTGPDNQDDANPAHPPLNQRRRSPNRKGEKTIEQKFDRRPRDYEWTSEDPRIKHLILVSTLVKEKSVAKAKAYLLSAGLIKAKSTTEQAGEAVSRAWETAGKSVFQTVASLQLGDTYDTVKKTVPEKDQAAVLNHVLEQKRHAMKRETARLKARPLSWKFRAFIIAGITLAAVGIGILFYI